MKKHQPPSSAVTLPAARRSVIKMLNNSNSNFKLLSSPPSSSPIKLNSPQKLGGKTSSLFLKHNIINDTWRNKPIVSSSLTTSASIITKINSSPSFSMLISGSASGLSIRNSTTNSPLFNSHFLPAPIEFVTISPSLVNKINGTDTEITSDDFEGEIWHAWLIPLLSLFALLTTFGNGLVAFSILSEKALRTSTNFCLVSLALADMLVGAVVMPLATSQEWYQDQWVIGTFTCNIYQACDVMASTCSILNLCLISHNRYMAISKPLIYNTSHRRKMYVALGIGATWIVSIGISAPLLLGVNELPEGTNHREMICAINNGTYAIYLSIISFFLPSIAIAVQHVIILRALAERARHIKWRVYTPQLSAIGDLDRPKNESIKSSKEDQKSLPRMSRRTSRAIPLIPAPENNLPSPSGNHESLIEVSSEATGTDNHLKPAMANKVLLPNDDPPSPAMTSDEDSVCFDGPVSPPPPVPPVPSHNLRKGRAGKTTHASLDLSNASSDGDNPSRRFTVVSGKSYTHQSDPVGPRRKRARPGRRNTETMTIVINMPRPSDSGAYSQSMNYRDRPRASVLSSPAKCKSFDLTAQIEANNLNKKRRTSSAGTGRRGSTWSSTRLLREDRAIAMLFMITVGFFTCWLPYFVATIVNGINQQLVPAIVMDSLRWLGHINSTMNPIFYSIFNKEFRIAVWRRLTLQPNIPQQMSRAPSVVSQMGGVGLSLLYSAASRLNNEPGRQ